MRHRPAGVPPMWFADRHRERAGFLIWTGIPAYRDPTMPVRRSSTVLRRPVNQTKRKAILELGPQPADEPASFGERL
jgi:hypothetical protein